MFSYQGMFQVDYIVNSIFTSRTYILSEESADYVWLVDCGDVDKILAKIGSKTIKGVLLTHVHFDHIYGLPEVLDSFPNVFIYTNDFGVEALGNDKLNMSRYHELPLSIVSDNIVACCDGTVLPLFEELDVIMHHTPGHNPSCLTFEIGDSLFTGDAYIPGIKVVTTLPRANKAQAVQSWLRIMEMAKGRIVYPGHEVQNQDEQSDIV